MFGCMVLSVYGTLPASLALGSLMKTASPGAASIFAPGLHNSCPFFPALVAIPLPLLFAGLLLFRFLGASSSLASPSSSSSTSLSGGDDIKLADSSSSSYPDASFSISDSDSGFELSGCSKYGLFFGVVLEEVIGEDLMRLDWREGVVDSEARFKGVEALGKWERR